jgi:ABC-type lipopolysaccharide export system ATPase subunit
LPAERGVAFSQLSDKDSCHGCIPQSWARRPKLLLLEERSLGLVRLFAEPNASAVLDISDYAYVRENGQIRISGPAAGIAKNSEAVAAYLGTC